MDIIKWKYIKTKLNMLVLESVKVFFTSELSTLLVNIFSKKR